MLRFITHRLAVPFFVQVITLLTLAVAGIVFATPVAHADGTITIERGQTMPTIYWSVIGVDSCIPSFEGNAYPDNRPDENIRDTWRSAPRAAIGSTTFNGQKALGNMSGTWPQTYVFTCSAGAISDKTTLVINGCSGSLVWDPVKKECSGAVPTASFTAAPNCRIAAGAAGCNPTVSWTSTNVTGGVTLADCGLGVYATRLTGNQSSQVYVPYNSGCYRIYNGQYSTTAALQTAEAAGNTSILAQTTITSSCDTDTTWNTSAGMCISNLPPTVTVTAYTAYGATAGSAYYGEYGTARIQWVATGSGVSCTVYRDGTAIAGPLAYPTVTQYVVPQSRPLVANTTFRVDCSNGNGSGQGTATFTVPPVPTGLSASCAAPGDKLTFNYTLPNGYTKAYIRAYKTPPASISHEAACSPVKSWPDGTCASGQTGSSYTMDSTPGATYYWYMHTQGVLDGNWSDSVTSGAVTCTPTVLPPTPPATISATPGACGTGIINVAWSSVSGATQYELQDGATTIYTGTNTNFSHSGLAAGSNHNYRVRVTTANGTSDYTVPVAANAPAVCTFPNLVSTSLSFFPSSIATGANIYLAGRITNQGGVVAAPFTNGVMYIDANNDGVADYTTPASAVGVSLAPASFADSTANWTVPVAAIPGTQYRFGYFIDPLNTIDEGPGDGPYANWSGWSAPFTVTSTNAPCAAGVSKTWTDGSFTCSAVTQATASGVNGTVVDSTDPTTGSASYQCTNGVWAVTPQTGATCGLTAYPDLVPSVPTVSAATVNQGDSITFRTNTIRNSGNAQAGPHNVGGFYIDYNNDGTADYTAPIPRQNMTLTIGGSYTQQVVWPVPANAPALATYRVSYWVDASGEVSEGSGESNNWSGWSVPFTVTGTAAPDKLETPEITVLQPVNVNCNIMNGGRALLQWSESKDAEKFIIKITNQSVSPNTSNTYEQPATEQRIFRTEDHKIELLHNNMYSYEVRAEAVGKLPSDWSSPKNQRECAPIQPSLIVNAPVCPATDVRLRWAADTTDHGGTWKHFTIFRNSGGTYEQIGQVTSQSATSFNDTTAPIGLNTYYIVAESKNKSKNSDSVTITKNACVTNSSCIGTTIASCTLGPTLNDSTSGSCSSGYTGTCSYTCKNGSWDISAGTNTCLADAISLKATKPLVSAGETVRLEWNIGSFAPASCAISGPGYTPAPLSGTTGTTGDVTINSRSTFTLTCGSESARATVELRPSVIES